MNSTISQIGPYRGRCIATGGFADVYYIPDSIHGGPVALKWSHSPHDQREHEALAHEFSLLSEFRHHRLPRALAFGWEDQRPYLVLDWIEGQSLWDLDPAEPEESFVITLREIARVLTMVHHRGWVHGDLKPDNLLWGKPASDASVPNSAHPGSPVLYLMDFGLARPIGDRDRPRGAGTMGYTAPEFLRREPADGRADWYSVGIILYEWIFGQRPFTSEEPAVEVAGHLEHSPDLNRPMVRIGPDWIPDLLARLLAKAPDERGANVLDLLAWMSRFDPKLHPDVILEEQLNDYRLSADRRITLSDSEIIGQILQMHRSSESCVWVLNEAESSAQSLARGLICKAARTRERLTISEASMLDDRDVRWNDLPVFLPESSSGSATPSTHVTFQSAFHAGEVLRHTGEAAFPIALTRLPWDIQGVGEYLTDVTGSAEFARQWSARIWEVTGGLPGAVSSLLEFLASSGQLRRRSGSWVLDEPALAEWQDRPEAALPFAEMIGELSPDERRIVDWFALGRSYMQIDVLGELLSVSSERMREAFHGLRSRGIVVPALAEQSFLDWRLRLRGLDCIWRSQLPKPMRRRLASRLASAIENCSIQNDTLVSEVQAACCGDAQQWDKCVHYAVTVVAARIKENRPEAALPFITLAAAAAQQIPEGKSKSYWTGRAQMARGDYQAACGQLGDALQSYRELLVFGRKAGDRRLLAETLKDLGSLYRMTRRFEKGVHVLRRARQLWEEIGDRAEVARTLNNLGNMYWVASDRQEARRYYSEGLQIARELGEDQIVANILSNLGVTYKGDYDFAKAESYYRDSLAIKERLDLPAEIALTLNNLGVIAYDQGRLLEADRHFRRAVDLNDSVGAEVESIFARGNLIQVILERGDLRTAIAAGDAAVRDADTLGDVSTSAEIRAFMAEAYQRAGDFRTSRTYLGKARALAAGQKNYDLDGHLGLVEAIRSLRLGMDNAANAILDGIAEAIEYAEMPRLRMDAAMIRVTTAVARGDDAAADDWWRRGQDMARMFSAPHKLAQLAFSRLPADPGRPYPHEARQQVEEFLSRSDDCWHWAASYWLWEAGASAALCDWENAAHHASRAIGQLREDGNWETLWRALEVYGRIHYKQSDYEPALSAFNEAVRILDEIVKTIGNEDERRSYREHLQARNLTEARQRIVELVA